MKILTIVPTRGRPEAAKELANFWNKTKPKSWLSLAVDNDDESVDAYFDVSLGIPKVSVVSHDRLRMGGTLNYWAKDFAPYFDVIGFMGDDHRPRGDWETQLTAAFEADSDLKVVYGNDLVWGEGLPTACWQSAEIVRRLGYFSPPRQTHLYLDNYWLALGNATKRVYLPDMIIEHMHPSVGKATWDTQYLEVNDQSMYDHDRIEFERYMAEEFESEMEKLK